MRIKFMTAVLLSMIGGYLACQSQKQPELWSKKNQKPLDLFICPRTSCNFNLKCDEKSQFDRLQIWWEPLSFARNNIPGNFLRISCHAYNLSLSIHMSFIILPGWENYYYFFYSNKLKKCSSLLFHVLKLPPLNFDWYWTIFDANTE